MSFDIFLQAFEGGDAADRDGRAVRDLLLRSAERYDPEDGFARVLRADGEADVYGVPAEGAPLEGLMFNHVAGAGFDLIVDVARAADLVVMPVGCPVCLIDDAQRRHLPPELTEDGVAVVDTGASLVRVIEGAPG